MGMGALRGMEFRFISTRLAASGMPRMIGASAFLIEPG
jgi:hypothetical protein